MAPYQEENRSRPQRELREEAIALAMQNRWDEAVEANKALIEAFPTDVGGYNQLGRALMELGRFAEAKRAYARALELAPGNAIARKNLDRLSVLPHGKKEAGGRLQGSVAPELFVRETGKSRVVKLYHVAARQVLAKMAAGDQVFLHARGKHLVVENVKKEVLGWVEPRYELRLLQLMKGGNQYAAAIVSLNHEAVKIIITETYQHPKMEGKLSFPVEAGPLRAGKDSLLRRMEEEEGFEEIELAGPEVEEETEDEGEGLPIGFSVTETANNVEEELTDKDEARSD